MSRSDTSSPQAPPWGVMGLLYIIIIIVVVIIIIRKIHAKSDGKI
jgi:hypothetical protein